MEYIMHIFTIVTCILSLGSICEAGIADLVAPKKKIEIHDFRTELCDTDHTQDRLSLNNIRVFTKDNGDLGLSGDVNTTTFLYAPFKVRVTMKRKILGVYVKMPCVKDFGSCTYDDLCQYGYGTFSQCPPSFFLRRTPCRCPIDEGVYSIPEDVHVPMEDTRWAGIAKGSYRAKVHFIHKDREIACYLAYFRLKSKDE
ncbi:hypothetical protein L9F63_012283 [Diploptera punctata]|uniref:MD-2-related lipid-recognition domain-containing protein n=1 Tax=Diploptera punctata TaxID=6984 RepID=A0AAD8ACQ7_DIPPU|nr:hypothetical protein L9F63_012283 [Diploptera punctata]